MFPMSFGVPRGRDRLGGREMRRGSNGSRLWKGRGGLVFLGGFVLSRVGRGLLEGAGR
jgi:hypothetical protein